MSKRERCYDVRLYRSYSLYKRTSSYGSNGDDDDAAVALSGLRQIRDELLRLCVGERAVKPSSLGCQ